MKKNSGIVIVLVLLALLIGGGLFSFAQERSFPLNLYTDSIKFGEFDKTQIFTGTFPMGNEEAETIRLMVGYTQIGHYAVYCGNTLIRSYSDFNPIGSAWFTDLDKECYTINGNNIRISLNYKALPGPYTSGATGPWMNLDDSTGKALGRIYFAERCIKVDGGVPVNGKVGEQHCLKDVNRNFECQRDDGWVFLGKCVEDEPDLEPVEPVPVSEPEPDVSLPYCGNGECAGSETADNCPQDCKFVYNSETVQPEDPEDSEGGVVETVEVKDVEDEDTGEVEKKATKEIKEIEEETDFFEDLKKIFDEMDQLTWIVLIAIFAGAFLLRGRKKPSGDYFGGSAY